jgi:cytochrome P450 family 142 subfamily A polypeptide 1
MAHAMTEPDVDIDYLDAEAWDGRAHERMRWLRENEPVYWAPKSDVFVLSKYDDIVEVSKNPELFCSGQGVRPPASSATRSTAASLRAW